MDINECGYKEESPQEAIRETNLLIDYIRDPDRCSDGHEPLIQPVLTPRFALNCSDELLDSLGCLAKSDLTLRIQTHISENKDEVADTLDRFQAESYAEVYEKFCLLRENTILAHAVLLSDFEVALIKDKKAGISHCPTSNFNLTSGIARVGYFLDIGVKVRSFSPVLMKYIFLFVIS